MALLQLPRSLVVIFSLIAIQPWSVVVALIDAEGSLLAANPSGPSSKGNEFFIGFIGNNRNALVTNPLSSASLFVTTDEASPVSFTVEYFGTTVTDQATKGRTTLINLLPIERDGELRDVRVGSENERNKGIRIKANGTSLLTVYGINDANDSTDAFLALPFIEYPNLVYRYYAFSTTVEGTGTQFESRFLIVGSEDDTTVTVKPTQTIEIPTDLTGLPVPRIVDPSSAQSSVNTGTFTLDQLETIQFHSGDDLTGTIIESNKPVSVFVGHECGQIPSDSTACDHLVEQVPPDATWGTQFFTVPLDVRESGERYRVGTGSNNNQVTVTCTTEGQMPRIVKNETIHVDRGMTQYVEFDTVGDDRNGVNVDYRRDFCCIETSKPAIVMMYSKGHSVDEITLPGVIGTQGDPFMLLIPPLAQYSNNYTITFAKQLRTDFVGHISYAIPHQFFDNSSVDRTQFLINGTAFTPTSGYYPIYCANQAICGYGAYSDLQQGDHTVQYAMANSALNLYVYGFLREISFAYPAGFEMEAIGVPRITIFDVTVFENVGTIEIPITRTGGDLERLSVILATSRDGTAVAGSDYVAQSNVRIRWRAGEASPRFITAPSANDPVFQFTIMDDDFPEDRTEYFEIDLVLHPSGSGRNGYFYPDAIGRVTILDDDILIPQIGFDPISYTVDEDAGEVVLRIRTSDPTAFVNATGALFYTNVTGGTATSSGAMVDFNETASANAIPIIFPAGEFETTISVPITDDNLVEGTERFFGRIRAADDKVKVFASTATIDIIDNDRLIFGFEEAMYNFVESVGTAMLGVRLSPESGQLTEDLVFTFTTEDITAEAPDDYAESTAVEYTFSPNDTRVDIPVNIVFDTVFEGNETFRGQLVTSQAGVVILIPTTTVKIYSNLNAQTMGSCTASTNCTPTSGENLATMTLEECCLSEFGFAFVDTNSSSCAPCIVFGFFEDSFTGIEQGQSHVLQVGWQKGAEQAGVNLVLDVNSTDITASSRQDYTVVTNQVKFLYLTPDPPDDVILFFHVDGVAQEINETFTLELMIASTSVGQQPTGVNVFFKDTINVTVVDNDAVKIFFTEVDYRATEATENGTLENCTLQTFIPVSVIKTSRIANPIVLDVIPLTVDEARAKTPPALPDGVPNDDPFSPPFADLDDFDNTVITITFDSDENNVDNELSVPIYIVDDAVNEADEQVFIVQLHLVDSINPALVDITTRPASICKITDDDSIRIGFEMDQYTYTEPKFDTTIDDSELFDSPVYLVKEDDVESEQTFFVLIQVSNSVPSGSGFNSALLNSDYTLGVSGTSDSTVSELQFSPSDQRLLFSFTLLSDDLPEGTEPFHAILAPKNSGAVNGTTLNISAPVFDLPMNLSQAAYIVIEDDELIIIGFNESNYTVDESVGNLEVFVSVIHPDEDIFSDIHILVRINSGSASSTDYAEFSNNKLNFTREIRSVPLQVKVTDDELLESLEEFNLELEFYTGSNFQKPSGVILQPNVSTVYIMDDDNITIGFLKSNYSTLVEDGSQFSIQVGVLSGLLRREVIVHFSINGIHQHSFTFNSTTTTLNLPNSIINDVIFELTESATANIAFPGAPIDGVTLSPSSAIIRILDALIIGFNITEDSVDEDSGSITLTILVRGVTTDCNEQEWTIHFSTQDISAHESMDFTAKTLTDLTFNDTSQNATVTITILDDDILEVDEMFRVEITSNSSNCLLLQPNFVDITIKDNDFVTIGFDCNGNYSVSEGQGVVLIPVELMSGELEREVVTQLIYKNGSAIYTVDFIENNAFQLTFDQDNTNTSISIAILDDDMFEKSVETFVVLLSTNDPRVRLECNETTISIIDDDIIVIGFINTIHVVEESAGSVDFFILITGELDINFYTSVDLITVTALNMSAQEMLDFKNVTITKHYICEANATIQAVQVTIIDDDLLEYDVEQFQLVLEVVSEADRICLEGNTTTVTITDNDMLVIGFTNESFTVTEGVDVQNITVGLISGQLERNVTVVLTLQSDSAIVGDDFNAYRSSIDSNNYRLTFSPQNNNMPQNFSLYVKPDDIFENVETFNATLTAGFLLLNLDVEMVNLKNTLCNEDVLSHLSVSASQDTSRDENISIPFDKISLTKNADDNIELRLASVESDRVSVKPVSTQVIIQDNDRITIGFDSSSYSVRECDGHVTVRVKVNDSQLDKDFKVVVNLSTSDMSAFADVNYQGLTNYLMTFEEATTKEKDIPIYITNDTDIGMDEEFFVTLSYSGEDITRVSLEPQNATVAIFEIDGRVGFFSPLNIMVNEGDTVNITVGLMSDKLICDFVEVMINFTTNNSDATGNDYSLQPESPLTLTSEHPNATITISICDDDLIETSETFEINLYFYDEMIENCSYNRLKLSPSTVTVQMIDNDGDVPTIAAVPSTLHIAVLIGSILGAVAFLLIIGIILLIIIVCYINKRNNQKNSVPTLDDENVIPEALRGLSVQSSYKLNLAPYLIIDSSTIRMTETIGQGEFGVVYKAHIMQSEIVTETVAVKTLKGFYDKSTVRDMLKECSKMRKFDHPNVLKLRGVCVDGGPSPFIIMPFMTNGSLLSYLKSNRGTLIVAQRSDLEDDEDDQMSVILKRLMDMCLQVAMGMEYLAMKKVVHRDLAARNCMIDMNFVIKVADFGLAESVGTKDYFRQDKLSNVKLPLKWLAPESLEDYIFSEKSDVWAYGVTSWEVFTAGKVPYATVNLLELPSLLANGHRLNKPANEACSDEMYSLMLHCWETDPKDRPTFSDIVRLLSVALEGLVGYMDIGAFGEKDEPKPLDPETSADKPKSDDSSVKDLSESKVCESQDDRASCEETKL